MEFVGKAVKLSYQDGREPVFGLIDSIDASVGHLTLSKGMTIPWPESPSRLIFTVITPLASQGGKSISARPILVAAKDLVNIEIVASLPAAESDPDPPLIPPAMTLFTNPGRKQTKVWLTFPRRVCKGETGRFIGSNSNSSIDTKDQRWFRQHSHQQSKDFRKCT